MGLSRQAYYQAHERSKRRAHLDDTVLAFVQAERRHQPRLGTRKLHFLLHQQPHADLHIGRDRLFALLARRHLLVATRRAYHKTTHSHHRFRRHPNRLKPGPDHVTPARPNHVWVADITYLPTLTQPVYLSLITDAYSRKIVGHHVHDDLRAESVATAYQMALRQRDPQQPLLHHSDRGIQYCSTHYQALHHRHGVDCSMTDGYDCYQNALAERINGILKNELLLHRPRDLNEAQKMVRIAIRTYNDRRPHLALKYKTPDEVHRAF